MQQNNSLLVDGEKNAANPLRKAAANFPQSGVKFFDQWQTQGESFLDGENIGADFFPVFPRSLKNERTPPQAAGYRSFSRGIAFGV